MALDRLRKLWQPEQSYEPLESSEHTERDVHASTISLGPSKPRFSYVEYYLFLVLGVSMLWAWNMFLAAGPYFQHRFRDNDWVEDNFQAAEISVSTITNLGSMLILTRLQAKASYPKRIITSLIINMIVFSLLAVSTKLFTGVTAAGYFGFLMLVIFSTSLATGLCQNGIFAYVSGYGQPSYTQAIMTGQAIAGVLPCIAQIVSVLAFEPKSAHGHSDEQLPGPPQVNSSAALAYFLTATVISVLALLAFSLLLARNRVPKKLDDTDSPDAVGDVGRKSIPFTVLFSKLRWLSSAVFITFAVTMVGFPVFTQQILSNRPPQEQSALFRPASFIPLAFLFWNSGDLMGRLITAVPTLSLIKRPRVAFGLSLLRIGFVGMYHLCNIRGRGAAIPSDFFYLVVVQLFFGISNGYLGSTCMVGAGEWVDNEEREAAGGFMGLSLVAGLTAGSLASFFAAGA